MPSPTDLRGLVHALLALRQLSVSELARQAAVHRPNLVSWLGGKEHVLSEQKQVAVADTLGWRSGRLRRDSIHHWRIDDDCVPITTVLQALQTDGNESRVISVTPTAGAIVGGAILLVVDCVEAPTEDIAVVLIEPQPHYRSPSARWLDQLGESVCRQRPQFISTVQFEHWWKEHSDDTPADYLAAAGDRLLADLKDCANAGQRRRPDVSRHEIDTWLGLLADAKASGFTFDEIVARTERGLSQRDE